MKARLTATLRNAATGAMESITLDLVTPNGDSALFWAVEHLAKSLHAFRKGHWSVQHVGMTVDDCPPGFFPAHQHGHQPLQHEEGD